MGTYYLGTHEEGWLWNPGRPVPLCISRRRLERRKKTGRAQAPWILDSGGYTELSMYGKWTITPEQYVDQVARWSADIGSLSWAAPMDHMCEPWVIGGGGPKNCPGTGLDVERHQQLTVGNFLLLRQLWDERADGPCPFIPVLQGWTPGSYLHCAEMYEQAGVDLGAQRTVGIGSVCRRTNVLRIAQIIDMVANGNDWKLHGFGVKTQVMALSSARLESADSLAWSQDACYEPPLPGHTHKHCNNCREWAAMWLEELPLERYGWAA